MKFCSLKPECNNCKYWRFIASEERYMGKHIGNCYFKPANPIYTSGNSIQQIDLIPKRPIEFFDSFCSEFSWNKMKRRENIKDNIKKKIFFWRKKMIENEKKCENCKHYKEGLCKKNPNHVKKDPNDICSEWKPNLVLG